MNKLEMGGLSTVRRSDGEVEEVPIRPTKPFFFSKVSWLESGLSSTVVFFGWLIDVRSFFFSDRSLPMQEKKSRFIEVLLLGRLYIFRCCLDCI